MRSDNPALNDDTFWDVPGGAENPMTINGAVNKSFILIILVMISAYWSWFEVFPSGYIVLEGMEPVLPSWYIPLIFVSFVLGIYIIKNPKKAPYLVQIYALLEGATLGALSAYFEYKYPEIAIQAVTCTFVTFLCMLIIYKTGLIKVTDNYRYGLAMATAAVFFIYLISIVLAIFGFQMPFIHDNGMFGIATSVFFVGIAALNLTLDFDFIEAGAKRKAEKHMEWYSAFGLLITLLWLYVEFLRLLAKGRSR